ncbi:TPR repeat-containing protein [Tenacibaculum sp. 190130A14a]|uniref:histidine kinase n=1 Tax=Tenacibaculum polynesiense TaxID=3137857 RepID=A0ABM9PFD6_9FLAO
MEKIKVFLFLLFTTQSLVSQTEKSILDINAKRFCEEKKEEFCTAYTFFVKKQYDSSYIYSSKAIDKVKSQDEKDILNYILGISAIRKRLLKKALASMSEISDYGNYPNLKRLKSARIYLSLKDYDSSLKYYLEWEKFKERTKKSRRKEAYHNIGLCYVHKKEYDKSREYFDKELALINKEDTLSLVRAKMDLANVYYNQYLDDDAIPLFQEAYDLAKLFSDVELKQFTAQNMAVVERNRKRYKESVEYYREFIKWKDSLFNRDKIWELTEKDKQLAVAQKESEIALQDEKIKRQRVVQHSLIAGASGLLIFLGFLAFLYKKLKKQNVLITQQKEDLNIANKTKNYLFSVVSHDLRSPMNTIQYQHEQLKKHIDTKDIDGIKEANNTAIAVTKSTSHLLNNVLHWSLEQSNQLLFNQGEHALKPLIEHILFDYGTLMEAKEIAISSEVENQLVKIDKESIKIVVRNLIDNAIKYMDGKGRIKISAGKESEEFSYIKIHDTGIGISKEQLQKINALTDLSIDKIDRSEGVGLGLILCQTLIKKNNGKLTFSSELGKGTTVKIVLQKV